MNPRLQPKRPHQHSCASKHPKAPWCFCVDREATECSKCRHITFRRYVDSLSTEALLDHRA